MQSDALRIRKVPRQRRAVHTVDALLEAAALVLEEDGLEGFNTNAVARRAGASVGSLYQYFPSKDALTLALLLREDRAFHDAASATLELPTFREALTAFIGVTARQWHGRSWLCCWTSKKTVPKSAPRSAASSASGRCSRRSSASPAAPVTCKTSSAGTLPPPICWR